MYYSATPQAPELMLTGHGGHPQMADNAEPVPAGPLAQAVLAMSKELEICICVGIAELDTTDLQIYNSQFVVDKVSTQLTPNRPCTCPLMGPNIPIIDPT